MADLFENYDASWEKHKSREIMYGGRGGFLLENAEQMGFTQSESMIDIGAACGEASVTLINNCLPNLKRHVSMDVNGDLVKKCQQRVAATGRAIQAESYHGSMETYPGPGEPVDLILMLHVIYYMCDCLQEQLARAYQWLRPGGHLIISVESSDYMKRLLEVLPHVDYSGINGDYIRQVLTEQGYTFTEYECVRSYLDISNPGNGEFLTVLLSRSPSPEEWKICQDALKELVIPGTERIPQKMSYFSVVKA